VTIKPLIGPNGRMPILVRDDDTNYFTRPEMLDSIYSKSWIQGFKVSLSTIPMQKGINDPCVPPQKRKSDLTYPIIENQPLIKYLKKKIQQGSVEVLQHGVNHAHDKSHRGEFAANSISKEQILKGREIISTAFGTEPKFFVPPGEDISQRNLELISHLGMTPIYRNIIFDSFLRTRYVPSILKTFALMIMIDNSILTKESNLAFPKPVNIELLDRNITWSLPSSKFMNQPSSASLSELTSFMIDRCNKLRTPVCILNHYHSYFFDWNSTITKNELFKSWSNLLQSFNELDFGWKVDFTTLFERFRKVGKVNILKTGSKITVESKEEIEDYSFWTSVPLEENSIGLFDKQTKICTVKNIMPQRRIVLYEKE
jgi:Uncharacterized protein conserved in bacteria (DUF2334)